MDNRCIGIFDSGLGGLTVVKALRKLMPNENIIYLGDTGRVPYGSRSQETIKTYTAQNVAFLNKQDIKAMVVACNTVCSVAFDTVKTTENTPVYEVVKTPAKAAAQSTKNNKVGVIGTTATIRSGAYEAALHELNPQITVHSIPCPLLVPLVEEGWTNRNDETAVSILKRYLKEFNTSDIDTLILGCTHYPLLIDQIKDIMGESITLIDSGAETAGFIASDLKLKEMLNEDNAQENRGLTEYYVTDSIAGFSERASKFLGSDIINAVTKIELE